MNGRFGNSEIAGVVGKWNMDEVNENGEYLVDTSAEKGLFLANPFYQHKMIHRYTWGRRDELVEQKKKIDYIATDEKLRKDVLAVRRMHERLDHYVLLIKIRLKLDRGMAGK